MSILEKPDAKEIRNHINNLKKEKWLGPARSWWPDFLFHFTNVRMAASILTDGAFLCRNEVSKGKMITDNASPIVIGNTDDIWKGYVRLYFRPRTPTQYNNEGCRPIQARPLGGANCPIPIFFLLDSKSILSRQDTLFSDGNLAAGARTASDANSFKSLPFESIYHDSPVYEPEKSSIIFHRCAEVIVPNRLDLNDLKVIWCRSQAECTTLLYTLPPNVRKRWENQIGAGARMNLFFGRWTYVEEAQLNKNEAILHFNKNTMTPGPFDAWIKAYDTFTGEEHKANYKDYNANKELVVPIPFSDSKDYMFNFFLDNELVFAGRYQQDNLPF